MTLTGHRAAGQPLSTVAALLTRELGIVYHHSFGLRG